MMGKILRAGRTWLGWGAVLAVFPSLACGTSTAGEGPAPMAEGGTSEGASPTNGSSEQSDTAQQDDTGADTGVGADPCGEGACSGMGVCSVVDGEAECLCDVGFQPDGAECVENGDPAPANYALDIIAPRPNLDTTNRFYKAYPALDYNVRLAVAGGEFPFRFNLDGPDGMTIDARGEIDWPEPAASATPYNVTATVTDANFNVTSVTWDITVTTDGFRFIDSVNGATADAGAAGTLEDPWRSIKDMYEGDTPESRFADSYQNEFLYWREGTYPMDAYVEGTGIALSGRKPLVWLAYPGESPVIDLGSANLSLLAKFNVYFEGLDFDCNGNERGMAMTISSGTSNVVIRNNRFHGITNGFVGGNNALVFITRSGPGQNFAIQDNEMFDVNNGYGVLGYDARNVVVEGNFVHDIGGHAIGPKMSTGMWFIRSNEMRNIDGDSIGLQYYVGPDPTLPSGDIEIAYNLVPDGGGRVRINSNRTSDGLPVHIFRNTFAAEVVTYTVTPNNGPFRFYNNVIINEQGQPDNIERVDIIDESRLEVFDNLVGVAADNIVDVDGNLQPAYAASIGVHGHMLAQ